VAEFFRIGAEGIRGDRPNGDGATS
jgi:hypothetical protein